MSQSLLFDVPAVTPVLPAGRPVSIPVYAVRLVRSDTVKESVTGPNCCARVARALLAEFDREAVVLICLDVKGKVLGTHIVSIGDLDSSIVHPREVFKAAILMNAASIVLAHNHPSGDPTPSGQDIAVTRRIREAGEVIGIELLDHIIIGDSFRYTSLKERGLM